MATSPLYINAVFNALDNTTVFYGNCRSDGMLFVPNDLDSPMLIVTLYTINLPAGGQAATLVSTSLPAADYTMRTSTVQGVPETCILIPYDNTASSPLQFTINITNPSDPDGPTLPIDPTVINVDPPGGGTPVDLRRGVARADERTYHPA
jgi:hypothetical protein